MTKLKAIVAAMVVVGVSNAYAAPPDVPAGYATGPLSPVTNTTKLSVHERAAFAMIEALLQMTEGKIHADGCTPTAVGIPADVYSDALGLHEAELGTFGNKVNLVATVLPAIFRGQQINTNQVPAVGAIAGTPVGNFASAMFFNAANNMMVGQMRVDVMGANGALNQFTGLVIKDFYMGKAPLDHVVIDWGLQSLSKLGYPVEKYWQRSQTRRSDGGIGRTVFVKDRLVGNTKCRITIDLSGTNAPDLFWETGTLSISTAAPSDPVAEFGVGFP
jgi:hypothetical protein